MVDLTNVPNPHQGSLRYGKLDMDELINRIKQDAKDVKGFISLAITHQNEYMMETDYILRNTFFFIYESDGLDRKSVTTTM